MKYYIIKKLELRTMIYIILEHDPLVQSSCPNTVDLSVLTKLKLRLHELEKNPRKWSWTKQYQPCSSYKVINQIAGSRIWNEIAHHDQRVIICID